MAQAVQSNGRSRTESPARWHTALERALAGGVEIFRIAGTGEMVATSATHLDTVYRCDGHRCECEAALAGDPVCLHRAAARFILGWLPDPDPEPAAANCPECSGGGVIYVRACERAGWPYPDCETCGGTGIMPERRLHDAAPVEIVAA